MMEVVIHELLAPLVVLWVVFMAVFALAVYLLLGGAGKRMNRVREEISPCFLRDSVPNLLPWRPQHALADLSSLCRSRAEMSALGGGMCHARATMQSHSQAASAWLAYTANIRRRQGTVVLGGAQELYDIDPDLTTLGKVIGGGMPVGAYAGKAHIMELVAPAGPMYQAGTLSGNPLAMTAGLVTLRELQRSGVFEGIVARTERLSEGLARAASNAGITISQSQVGTMFGLFFTAELVLDYATAKLSDTERFGRYFTAMLDEGVYLAPSQFEAGFMSTEHTDEIVDETLAAAERAMARL